MKKNGQKKKRISTFQIIILGFAGLVLLGAFLLMLPISSKARTWTPFCETLFTSTSATCVTGLVVNDTATHWSVFGKCVLLVLIQIGGLGVITVASSVALLSGRKISLMQRSTMQEAMAAPTVGSVQKLTVFILKATLIFELLGALFLMPPFIRSFGAKGILYAIFHAVSAYCNAGFDLLGTTELPFQSLTAYAADPWVNITVMLLIIVGGIGFLTWDDILTHKLHVKKYRMQSKVVLVTSAVLIFLPALYFFFFDFSDKGIGERIYLSLFQSVTTRTAGFNTADFNEMTGAGRGIMIFLMLIGGSPGSTAGGMKTTTVAVLFLSVFSVFRRKEHPETFGRRISDQTVKNAAAILILYLTLFFSGAIVISTVEGLPFATCLFETASAVGTVGLTLGITSGLGLVSQLILIVLMFLGRVGGLTLIFAALSRPNAGNSKLPEERITVG